MSKLSKLKNQANKTKAIDINEILNAKPIHDPTIDAFKNDDQEEDSLFSENAEVQTPSSNQSNLKLTTNLQSNQKKLSDKPIEIEIESKFKEFQIDHKPSFLSNLFDIFPKIFRLYPFDKKYLNNSLKRYVKVLALYLFTMMLVEIIAVSNAISLVIDSRSMHMMHFEDNIKFLSYSLLTVYIISMIRKSLILSQIIPVNHGMTMIKKIFFTLGYIIRLIFKIIYFSLLAYFSYVSINAFLLQKTKYSISYKLENDHVLVYLTYFIVTIFPFIWTLVIPHDLKMYYLNLLKNDAKPENIQDHEQISTEGGEQVVSENIKNDVPPTESSQNANINSENTQLIDDVGEAEIIRNHPDKTAFIWGRSNSGKTTLIKALQQSTKVRSTAPHVYVNNEDMVKQIIDLKKSMISTHASYLGIATTGEKNYVFDIVDDKSGKHLKITVQDGAGEAMFPISIDENEIVSNQDDLHKKLTEKAKEANYILLCVNATEIAQNYFDIILPRFLANFTENNKIKNCEKFIIVLTNIDSLANIAYQQVSNHLSKLKTYQSRKRGITPEKISHLIDPVQQAKMIIGKSALIDIKKALNKDAQLLVALCSAYGFNEDGNLIFQENAEDSIFNMDSSYSLGEDHIDQWRPFGVLELLDYLLLHRKKSTIEIITKKDIYEDVFNRKNVIIPSASRLKSK